MVLPILTNVRGTGGCGAPGPPYLSCAVSAVCSDISLDSVLADTTGLFSGAQWVKGYGTLCFIKKLTLAGLVFILTASLLYNYRSSYFPII